MIGSGACAPAQSSRTAPSWLQTTCSPILCARNSYSATTANDRSACFGQQTAREEFFQKNMKNHLTQLMVWWHNAATTDCAGFTPPVLTPSLEGYKGNPSTR